MTGFFGPQGANAVTVLPNGTTQVRYVGQTWVKDASAPGMNDGTVLDAAFFNRIIGNLDYILGISGVSSPLSDETALYKGIMGAVAGGAPDALNTLKELADALGDDANFAANVTQSLSFRLRFDQPQTLSLGQKDNVYSSLGLPTVAFTGSYADLLNLPTLGTASPLNVGTAAGNIPQLGVGGKLPAVDGSLLTNITATWGNVTGKPAFGTAALGTLGVAATDVVQLDASAKLPAVDGSALTNVTVTWTNVTGKPPFATVATSGAYADLTGKPTLGSSAALNVGTSANSVVQLDGSGKMPPVDGSALTNVTSQSSVGQIGWFPSSAVPAGWVALNGALLSRTTYANLWAYANGSSNIIADGSWSSSTASSFSTGDLSTTFRVPDHRGEFLRSFDNGRGIDSGRTIGSWQQMQFENHSHTTTNLGFRYLTPDANDGSASASGSPGWGAKSLSVGTASSGNVGSETRPRNVTALACIKV